MVAAGCSSGDWEAVEERWNLPRYYAMVEHWKENGPPVYMAAAGYLGLIKPKSSSDGDNNLEELASMFASTGGNI